MKPALALLLIMVCLLASGCGYRDQKKNPGPKTEAARAEYMKHYADQVVALANTEESAEAAAKVVWVRCQPLLKAVEASMREENYDPWFIHGFKNASKDNFVSLAMSDIIELREEWMRQGTEAANREAGR